MSKDNILNFKATDLSKQINDAVNTTKVDTIEDVILGNLGVMFDGNYNVVMEMLLRSAVRLAAMSYTDSNPEAEEGNDIVTANDDRFACSLRFEKHEVATNDK